MQIKQWKDDGLAQFSYAILSESEKKIVLIDPSRNPQQYLDYANDNDAAVIAVIETHLHADFVSSHLEISHRTGATIYASPLTEATYPHQPFGEGDVIALEKLKLIALDTPGHSPESISILVEQDGERKAIFSGDTLFIGDCGRPDLREDMGSGSNTRHELAKAMYHTLRNKFLPLADEIILYPAHGAGTLCGKRLSKASQSTMGEEKRANWSLQAAAEDEFVQSLLNDQPFIPAYFSFNVALNKKGASPFKESVDAVTMSTAVDNEAAAAGLDKDILIVDARTEKVFKKGHLTNAINLMQSAKFETWLGSSIKPEEPFYLAGESNQQLKELIERAAAIGYEPQIKEAFVVDYASQSEPILDVEEFKKTTGDYTIIDVRNVSEEKEGKPFKNSIVIPLGELRNRANEIPAAKPIVVHCASGYRSAAGSSIIKSVLGEGATVFDLGDAIKQFL